MLFWIIAVIVALALALALVRAGLKAGAETPAAERDLQVFRAQLEEVNRDEERGVMGPEDAARARTVIGRKLLDADRRLRETKAATRTPRGAVWGAAVLVALIFAGSFLLYSVLGAPGYQDLPLSSRLQMANKLYSERAPQAEAEAKAAKDMPAPAKPDPKMAGLMEQLRAAVAAKPEDQRGQMLLARNEAALGHYDAAWKAQQKLIALKGDDATAQDFADQAEMMILAAGGTVSPEAERALESALARDEKNPAARYYMGLMMAQNGRPDRTFRIWNKLLEEGPADAPWIAPIRQAMPQLAWLAGYPDYQMPTPPAAAGKTDPALPGPDKAAVDAAQQMSPADRQKMIRGMVDGLAARIDGEGGRPEEWARLISSLAVLGEKDEAGNRWKQAQEIFMGDEDSLSVIRAAAQQAGVAG